MATRRKLTLADIQGPGDKAQINPRGSVRPARERIRPGRFQPSKELLDFRGLSRTLNAAIQTAADYAQASEQADDLEDFQTTFAGKNQEAHDDLTADDGRPVAFLQEPEPLYRVEDEEGNVPDQLTQPGLVQTPDMTPPHLRPVRTEIGTAGREGQIPPLNLPTMDRAVGKMQGDVAARGIYDTMLREDMGAMSRGTYTDGVYRPEVLFEARLGQRYRQLLEQFPALDLNSEEANRPAIAQFQFQMRQYMRDMQRRVTEGLNADKTLKFATESVRGAHALIDSALDVTTSVTGVAPSTEQLTVSLDGYFGAIRKDTGWRGNLEDLQATTIVAKAKSIDSQYADNPHEREARLNQLLDAASAMQMGRTTAQDHPKFDSVEIIINKMLQTGGAAGGTKAKWTAVLSDSPAFALAREAMQTEDATALDKAMQEHRAWLQGEAAKLNLNPGRETKDFLDQGEKMWQQQAQPFGLDSTRIATSRFALNRIARMAAEGDIDGARALKNEYFKQGIIQFAEKELADDRLAEISEGQEAIQNNLTFRAAVSRLDNLQAAYTKFGLPFDTAQPVIDSMNEGRIAFRDEASRIYVLDKAGGGDGVSAVSDSLRSGSLKEMVEGVEQGMRTRVAERQTVMEELKARAFKGESITADQADDYLKRIGSAAQPEIDKVRLITSDRNVFFNDANTSVEWSRLGESLDAEINSFIRRSVDEGDPTGKQKMALMRERALPLMKLLGKQSNASQFSKSSTNWRNELMDKWGENLQTVVDKLPEFFKDDDLKTEMGTSIRVSQSALKAWDPKGQTKEQYESRVRSQFALLPVSADLRSVIDKEAWAKHLSHTPYGVKAKDRWDNAMDLSIKRIDSMSGVTDKHKAQLKYEMLQMTGRFTMDLLGGDAEGSMVFLLPERGAVTLDIASLKINPHIGPMFRTTKELEDFTSDGDRFAAVSERLGFGTWDPNKSPDSNPQVILWKSAQAAFIQRVPKPRR
jgi:hypothetical protein